MDIKELLNSIIEFIKEVVAGVQAALNGVKKTNGYEDAANYPDNFPKVAE